MVTTSYLCPSDACPVERVDVLRRDPPPTGVDTPPLCPWCCTGLTLSLVQLDYPTVVSPALPGAEPDPVDPVDQVTHAGDSTGATIDGDGIVQAADVVTHGDRGGFEPPRLRLMPRDDFRRRRTDPAPEPAGLVALRSTGDESPAEHLRNALQILAGLVSYDGALLQDPDDSHVQQITARLLRAAEIIPIGGDDGPELYTPELIDAVLAPMANFRAAVADLVNASGAHTDTARQAATHAAQMLRFALNSMLAALGPGTAPVPAAIAAAYSDGQADGAAE